MFTPTPHRQPTPNYPLEVHALLQHARRALWRERQQLAHGREAELTLLRHTHGIPPYQPQTIALRHDTDPVEQVRRLVPAVLPHSLPGSHAGVLLLADCLMLRGDADNEW